MRFQRVRLRSYAKINLGLHVLGKRDDGYHEIRTVFQTISSFDRLQIELSQGQKVEFECDLKELNQSNNLVVKAINTLKQFMNLSQGFRVNLEKRIPVGAGLGGGSSNAAATILGIKKLLNLTLSYQDLIELGGLLGSDVPFFFLGGTALGIGRGAEIYPLEEQTQKYLLLIVPSCSVSTVDAYARMSLPLTKRIGKSMIPVFCSAYLDSLEHRDSVKNDFEEMIFHDLPKLGKVKEELLNRGALTAALTGSGSALFGLFNSRAEVLKAKDAIEARNFRLIESKTLSRREYQNCLVESLQ
jgi:4-diphosphocytidyl-2-C-methyl-D-erythritol kinase